MTRPQEDQVRELERAVQRTTSWLLILLAVFVMLLVGSGAAIYRQAKVVLDADQLVARGEDKLREDFPEIRQRIKQQVTKVAPKVAAQASDKLRRSIPNGRREIEELLDRETDSGLSEGLSLSQQEFRRFLQANRQRIRQGFDELRRAPERTSELAKDLEKSVDAYLGTDIHQDIQIALEVLRSLNDKLRLLLEGGRLSRSEEVELRIVRILRAMQERGPGKVDR